MPASFSIWLSVGECVYLWVCKFVHVHVQIGDRLKEKINMGHHELPEKLQWSLELMLQFSGTVVSGLNTILLKDSHSFGVLRMVMVSFV